MRMPDSEPYPYQLGNFYQSMPIPAVPEHCIGVDAGPLKLVVESRELTNEILMTQLPPGSVTIPDGITYDDYGPTLHVCGADDGLEYLRFDCFEKEPHYHYIRHSEGGNLICRIDEIADGDPIEWTIGRVRARLPEMLAFAGADDLAEAARRDASTVVSATDKVVELLEQARAQSLRNRGTVSA
jgi:hypothetical protein